MKNKLVISYSFHLVNNSTSYLYSSWKLCDHSWLLFSFDLNIQIMLNLIIPFCCDLNGKCQSEAYMFDCLVPNWYLGWL